MVVGFAFLAKSGFGIFVSVKKTFDPLAPSGFRGGRFRLCCRAGVYDCT